MAQVTNVSGQNITIGGKLVKPKGSIDIQGKIPGSLRVLENLGALSIEGAEDEGQETPNPNVTKVGEVVNPVEDKTKQPTAAEVASENDQKIIDIMQALPAEAMMGDGRPEVREVNAKLSEAGLNNISAAERDRLWTLASKED